MFCPIRVKISDFFFFKLHFKITMQKGVNLLLISLVLVVSVGIKSQILRIGGQKYIFCFSVLFPFPCRCGSF